MKFNRSSLQQTLWLSAASSKILSNSQFIWCVCAYLLQHLNIVVESRRSRTRKRFIWMVNIFFQCSAIRRRFLNHFFFLSHSFFLCLSTCIHICLFFFYWVRKLNKNLLRLPHRSLNYYYYVHFYTVLYFVCDAMRLIKIFMCVCLLLWSANACATVTKSHSGQDYSVHVEPFYWMKMKRQREKETSFDQVIIFFSSYEFYF